MKSDLVCKPIRWQGRQAFLLENDLIRLVTLTGGGHIAELTFRPGLGRSTMNPLWVPNWKTMEPYRYRESAHTTAYGPTTTGKILSGITGHNLCLDYFGGPSAEEERQGLSIHGEAPSLRWSKIGMRAGRNEVSLELAVRLPEARLRFRRMIKLRRGESVVYLRESVENEASIDHLFHWTEHVTLGAPFLDRSDSRVFISGTRGKTFAAGYEGKELLDSGREFTWPHAPGKHGEAIDLRQPFIRKGRGLIATVLLDPSRADAYVGALNAREQLLAAYSFSRVDFPWAAVWEENRARTDPPWKGSAQARGLEFGSTPFPVGRREAFANGPLFDTPHFSLVPARSRKVVDYVAFLAAIPAGMREIDDVRCAGGEITVRGHGVDSRGAEIRLPASGLAA